MTESQYPSGWDAARVKQLIDHYENLSDEELAAEDDATEGLPGQAVVTVPVELLPAIRHLLAELKAGTPAAAPDANNAATF